MSVQYYLCLFKKFLETFIYKLLLRIYYTFKNSKIIRKIIRKMWVETKKELWFQVITLSESERYV